MRRCHRSLRRTESGPQVPAARPAAPCPPHDVILSTTTCRISGLQRNISLVRFVLTWEFLMLMLAITAAARILAELLETK
jgi:hypothetical protein